FFFFFSASGDPLDLHSFPTRRSSDLVNLLDWVVPDLQRPVLAHELTHALQDQSFGLDKWLKRGSEDLDTKRNLKPEDLVKDEDRDRKSTRLNSSHLGISYAVFCLKKK